MENADMDTSSSSDSSSSSFTFGSIFSGSSGESSSSSYDESSSFSNPFEGEATIYFGSSLPNMWYNVPDGVERNPDIIRAESALLVTPISQAYAAEAYGAIKNVQNVCAADYKAFCASPALDMAAVTNFLDNFMLPPRFLAEQKQDSDGLKLVNYLRSYYRKLDSKPAIRSGAHVKPASNLRKVSRSLKDIRVNKRLLEGRGPPPKGPPPPPQGGLPPKDAYGPPSLNGPHPPHGPAGADLPMGVDAGFAAMDPLVDPVPPMVKCGTHPHPEEGHAEGHPGPRPSFWGPPPRPEDEEGDGPPPPPPPAPHEDVFYNGALGFGAGGDMCLYENFNQLSQPCVQGVSDLYDVRVRYWHDSEESSHGHHVLFWVLAGLFLWFLVKRCVMRRRFQKVRTFLQAIHENPALKATIEAETGAPVPDLPCKGHLRGSRTCPADKDKCCLGRFCRVLATCVFVFCVSFFIAITSTEITGNIIANWDADAEARGDEQGTSPVAALLLLLFVTFLELSIFFLAVKAGKCLCAMVFGAPACDDSATPSAPPASPRVQVTTPAPTARASFWTRHGGLYSKMFSTGRRVHGDYTPLNGGEDETEMVTVVPASTAAPQYSLMPVTLSNGQTVLTVSAAPVTQVNMV